MAKQYHLDLLNQGVEVWNRWREDNPLIQPDLSGLNLSGVHLEGANLSKTHLEGTNLCKAYLGGKETLPAANLQGAFFNKLTNLSDINLGNKESGFISVADVEWGEVSLTSIDWKRVNIIGDEYEADRRKQFKRKQLDLYHLASQSNRQLALTLQAQGLFNDGARFAYNAHRCEQKLFMLQVFLSLIQLLNKSWLVHVAVKKHYSRSMHRVLGGVFSVVTFAESGLFAVQHIGLPLIIFIVTLTYLIYLSIFKPLLRLTLFILSILAILIALLFLLVIVALQYPIVASVLIGILSFLFGSLFDRLVQPRKIKTKGQRGGQVGAVSPSRKKASELIISLKQFAAQLFLVFTNYLRCVFSILLDVLAGYGYKPIRSLICYGVTIIAFTALYYVLGKLSVSEALVFSVTSFHGRGFFPGNNISLSDPRVVLASIEAVVGLLIEISFIATFTQRFLGK